MEDQKNRRKDRNIHGSNVRLQENRMFGCV